MEDPITCVASIVHRLAKDLSHADRQEVISASLVRVATGTEHAISAVRWSLADWLRDRTESPAPVEDTELRRELQHARRSVRSASADDLAAWDKLLARLPEREKQVAERLAAGYSMRDIAGELQIGLASADRARKAIRRMLGDSVLWAPILDALYSLPDSIVGRGEYVSDLTEYRRSKSAERSPAPIGKRRAETFLPRFQTWFVPCHEKRQSPLSWYPGMPIRTWNDRAEPKPAGLWAVAFGLGHEPNNFLRFADPHAGKRSRDELEQVALKRRERRGLSEGRRWFFESKKHGTMISAPVIRREYDADGMFRRHVQ